MTLNKEQIISEGYLEAYITEDMSKEDALEVENWIRKDHDISAEYYRLQKLVEHLAFQYKHEIPVQIKRGVMENPEVMTKMNSVGTRTIQSNGIKLMMAASVMVAVLSVLTSFYFWKQWQTSDEELSTLISQNLELAYNFNQVNEELTDLRQDVAVLISPQYQRVILDGTENSPDAAAVVYWNSTNQKVFLNTTAMLSLPVNKQYQLWALVDGQPVDAGIFDVQTGKFQIMKDIEKADAFAVTIEPKGGSVNPTLSTLQVIGNV